MILTPTHLAIVMEYAAGGELFDRIVDRGRFSEDEVLYYQIGCCLSTILALMCYSSPTTNFNVFSSAHCRPGISSSS